MTEKPEFFRPLAVRRIGMLGTDMTVEATPDECGKVARRLGLQDVAMLRCRYRLKDDGRGVVTAEGAMAVRFTQTCVVSMEAFEDMMAGSFVVRFVPAAQFVEPDVPDMDAIDEIPYDGQDIDLGEAVVEQFALDLEPYPHAPDVALPPGLIMDEEEADRLGLAEEAEKKASPFAGLARWRGGNA
ncbi:DUF177 domain-containing protein [Acetobacter okinawensis]|uniref:DUF177 domain-containing protein n=1 Tax=Acetobacter okinawensis TaxID=1076594 RepID=A0A252BZ70_9PROT|nr:DUF177 domain-containing protein [Acetobacter okinawensis]OUJ14091.1 hypothetical protein HK26_00415 [Acetobacter okinawensis]